MQRNILCDGTSSNKAEIRSSVVSYMEDDGITENSNKWVLANKDTCALFGTMKDVKTPLFTPQISKIKADGNKGRKVIDIEITGQSLFRCGKIWLEIQDKVDGRNDEIGTKLY